jgi:HPt (histidine-containing phosphotransfer) domain-containing protein
MDDTSFINFEEGRKFLANDHISFLKRFYDVDLQASIKAIRSSFDKKEWLELKRSAHSLKGTSSYIGAVTCRGLSETLQLACTDTPVNEIRVSGLVQELLKHLDELYKYLTNYFTPTENLSPVLIRRSDSRLDISPGPEETKEDLPSFTVKKLAPPVGRVTIIDNSHSYEEEEIDAYEEISKQWRCIIS